MLTVKEMMQAKKQRKQERLIRIANQAIEIKNRNLRNTGLQDYISPIEWSASSYCLYFNEFRGVLAKNQLTIDDLINQFTQLHRMTYWRCGYDFSNIREVIESVTQKYLADYTTDDIESIKDKPVGIHYKQRELLVMFIDVMCQIIPTYKSRKLFAIDNANMIIDHHVYCILAKPAIGKFMDWDGLKSAQETIMQRAESKERYLHAKQTKRITNEEKSC